MSASFLAMNGTGVNDIAGGTLTFTTTRQIEVGEHVCVSEGNGNGSATPTGVTVGSLTLTNRVSDSSVKEISLWSAPATATIASGTTVTITWGVTPVNKFGGCFSLAGVMHAGFIDATQKKTFASATALDSGVTAATSAGGVAVAVTHFANQSGATPGTGYTEQSEVATSSGGETWQLETDDNVPAGTQQASWTIGVAGAAGCAIAVFKASGQGPPPASHLPFKM